MKVRINKNNKNLTQANQNKIKIVVSQNKRKINLIEEEVEEEGEENQIKKNLKMTKKMFKMMKFLKKLNLKIVGFNKKALQNQI